MGSSGHNLSPLQRELLDAFFERESGFYLTGGAALVGFYLGHRLTDDLDFFTLEKAAFERGFHAVAEAVEAVGGALAIRQEAPGFRRYVASRRDEAVIIDLVLERVPQLYPEKPTRDGIRLDPPEEILANKLTALVARAEVRDLIDVMFLERAGFDLEAALHAALDKDGGCTPANLAWVLSQIEIPEGAPLPGEVSAQELRDYLAPLIKRLRRLAVPGA